MMKCIKILLSFLFLILILLPLSAREQKSSLKDLTPRSYIKTAHFRIIYEKADEKYALQIASFCEEVWESVKDYVGRAPKGRINCFLHGRTDLVNGNYSPYRPHINLFLAPAIDEFATARTQNWLRNLLVHELTHYFHGQYPAGFSRVLGKIFGPLFSNLHMGISPGWLIEGITTVAETRLSAGGRGRNPFFELYYKAPIVEGNLWKAWESAYMSPYAPPGRIYVAGYLIVNHIIEEYGLKAFQLFLEDYIKNPLYLDYHLVLHCGRDFKQLFSDMRQKYMQKYLAEMALGKNSFLSPEEEINYGPARVSGTALYLYRYGPGVKPAIIKMDPRTGEYEELCYSVLTDMFSLSVSADNEKIIFSSYENDYASARPPAITADLFYLDDGKVKQLTKALQLWHPALSPDGKRIIAVQRSGPYSRLVEINWQGKLVRVLFEEEQATVYNPVFGPQGKKIAFALNQDGAQDIILINEEGQLENISRSSKSAEYHPGFTKNGELLFTSDREGFLALYQYNLQSRELLRIHRDRVGAFSGVFLKDKLIYSSYSSRGFCLKQIASASLALKNMDKAASGDSSYLMQKETRPNKSNIKTRRFFDLPLPVIWFPLIISENPYLGSFLGAGLMAQGQSMQTGNFWDLQITVPFYGLGIFQPDLDISLSWQLARLRLNISGSSHLGYSADDELWEQRLRESLQLAIPLFNRFKLNKAPYLTTVLGLQHLFNLKKESPFHFVNLFNKNDIDWENFLEVSAGIGGGCAFLDESYQLYASPGIQSYLIFRDQLPFLSAEKSLFSWEAGLLGRLGLPGQQQLSLNIQAVQNWPEKKDSLLAPYAFAPAPEKQSGEMLLSLRYNNTLVIMDSHLFNYLSFQGIGMSALLQSEARWDIKQRAFIPGPYLYGGLELKLRFYYIGVVLDLILGTALRYDLSGVQSFDLANDSSFYIDFSSPVLLKGIKSLKQGF